MGFGIRRRVSSIRRSSLCTAAFLNASRLSNSSDILLPGHLQSRPHRSWVACCVHQVQNFDLCQRFWCMAHKVLESPKSDRQAVYELMRARLGDAGRALNLSDKEVADFSTT